MTIEVRPASVFEDLRTPVGPKSPESTVCWCLSYRIPSKLDNELRGPARGEYVAELCRTGPRSEFSPTTLTHPSAGPPSHPARTPLSRVTARSPCRRPARVVAVVHPRPSGPPQEGDLARPHRRRRRVRPRAGRTGDRGVPVGQRRREGRPHDGVRGLRKNFERAGFTVAARTTSVLAGRPRVLMRLSLE